MNNETAYNPWNALNAAKQGRSMRDALRSGNQETAQFKIVYHDVLQWVQNEMSNSSNYQHILTDTLENGNTTESAGQLQNAIFELLNKYPHTIPADVIPHFQKKIYNDMAGYGIITEFLEDPYVEEINVFGPGNHRIEIVDSRKGMYWIEDDGFPDAKFLVNLAKNMARVGGMTLDISNPRVDSYLGNGIRVSAMIHPIVPEEVGAYLSIRKQTKSSITREMLVNSRTAVDEELEFIELLTETNVSGAVVGATGSGKTTLLNFIMSDYVRNNIDAARVYIIEESRELQLPEDARVYYTAVCGDEKNGNFISAPDLLKSALRFHPTFISCAEIRGEEAMNAMNAAQTGHVVWSTFHADNCEDAYQRLLTMCKMSGTDLSEQLLMRNIVKAFPIIVNAKQLKDGSRKIMGIYEATGVNGIEVEGHYIYRASIFKYEYKADGRVKHVYGRHLRVGDVSDKLAQRMFDECGNYEKVSLYARPGWQPQDFAYSAPDSNTTLVLAEQGIDLDDATSF